MQIIVSTTLLSTKLNIPILRSKFVSRSRLIEKLNGGLTGRLTIISAPAGFGKTTLITDWLNQLSGSTHRWKTENCSWLSLDQHDNEPIRFFLYFISTIQTVFPDIGIRLQETLGNSPNPNIEALTQDLLNELAAKDRPLLIVLDDYHEIQNDVIHQIIQTFADFIPPDTHLAIATRIDPPLSLPRWRARNWLNEISAKDLRFDKIETSNFLKRTMSLELSDEISALLEDRTEGWAAGLQLAALSLADTNFSAETVQQFSGRDRHVAEYLLSEVLDHQSETVRFFLLSTSILDRFNADLCGAMLHGNKTIKDIDITHKYQNLIEEIERSNLFITPLDHEGYWYRYHHLFAQLLRQRLVRSWNADQVNELYRNAAQWFLKQGLLEEAADYSIQGQDFSFTAQLITSLEADNFWNQSWGLQLRKWGATLPDEILQEFPKAAINITLVHMTRGEVKKTDHYIKLVKEDPRVKGEILLIDAIFTRNQGDIFQALSLAKQAAKLLEVRDKTFYVAAQTQVIVCLFATGDLGAAETLATNVRNQIQAESDQFFNVYIQLIQILGIIKEQGGKLLEAERIYLEGIKRIHDSGKTIPLIGLLQARLGAISYEWNEIEKAAQYCQDSLGWWERTGITDILNQVSFVQVNLALRQKDKAAIENILERLEKMIDWPEMNDIDAGVQATWAYTNIRLGNLPPAIRWADSSGMTLEDQPSYQSRTDYYTLARVRYEEFRNLGIKEQKPKVVSLVDNLIELARDKEIASLAINCWLLKALILDWNDQRKRAITALHNALDLAFPGGFIRSFLHFGAPMRELLEKSLIFEEHMVYKRRLLFAFADEETDQSVLESTDSAIQVELTPRELDVLELIAGGLSNKVIQDQLTISKNTVRTHIKNLYSKLGVHSRTQAIQEARKRGLL